MLAPLVPAPLKENQAALLLTLAVNEFSRQAWQLACYCAGTALSPEAQLPPWAHSQTTHWQLAQHAAVAVHLSELYYLAQKIAQRLAVTVTAQLPQGVHAVRGGAPLQPVLAVMPTLCLEQRAVRHAAYKEVVAMPPCRLA